MTVVLFALICLEPSVTFVLLPLTCLHPNFFSRQGHCIGTTRDWGPVYATSSTHYCPPLILETNVQPSSRWSSGGYWITQEQTIYSNASSSAACRGDSKTWCQVVWMTPSTGWWQQLIGLGPEIWLWKLQWRPLIIHPREQVPTPEMSPQHAFRHVAKDAASVEADNRGRKAGPWFCAPFM